MASKIKSGITEYRSSVLEDKTFVKYLQIGRHFQGEKLLGS